MLRGQSVNWYTLHGALLGPYLGYNDDVPDLVKVLARACAGVGRVSDRWDPMRPQDAKFQIPKPHDSGQRNSISVELTDEQAAALRELFGLIDHFGKQQYAVGLREGRSLLLQLGRGDLSTQQFDGCIEQQRKQEARLTGDEDPTKS